MKNIYVILLAVVAVVTILTANYTNTKSQDRNIIYVAKNGNDHNPGTKSKPFRTLKKATKMARAGNVVFIRKGTYHEKLNITHSGTKSKPIHFKAYNKEDVILSGKHLNDRSDDTALVTIASQNYITISDLTIQDLSTDSTNETVMGMYITGSSSHITIKDNVVQKIETHAKNGNAHGIAVYGEKPMKDINILENTVENLVLGSSESLVLNGNINGFRIENNVVRRNNNIGIDLIGFEGTSEDKRSDYVRHGTVKGNTIHDISAYGNPAYGKEYSAGGIYVDGGKQIDIKHNTIYKSDIGIEATSEHANKYADQINIVGNTIYNNHFTGVSIGGYDKKRGGTKNTNISKNILYRNDTKGLNGGQLLLQHAAKSNVIERNILTAGPSRIFIANYFTTIQDNKLVRNVFHKETAKPGIWIWKDKEYTSFKEFKSVSKSDANSSYLDPHYKNGDHYNFKLQINSPATEIVQSNK